MKQATDFICSKNAYRLDQVIKEQVIKFCITCKIDLIKLLYVKN